MPLTDCFKNQFPGWSELDFVSLVEMKKDEVKIFRKKSSKEKLFVCEGECKLLVNGGCEILTKEEFLEINNSENQIEILSYKNSSLIHIGGRWSENTGSCGVFSLSNSNTPRNIGDPVDYERKTDFDNHYHDCDEYWIISHGKGLAVSEGIEYQLKPGAILATRAGDHHDFKEVFEEIHGVWFETSLLGKKRQGHLWYHTHGLPE